jgi:hypothetical protein
MALALTILGLLVALFFPLLCQLYGLLAGMWTMFSWIPLIFGYGSHTGAYRLELEPIIPFIIVNVPFSKFWIGWGLLVASTRNKSCLGFILGGSNVLSAAFGLFYFEQSTSLALGTGILGLVLTSLMQFFYGLVIIGTILAGWNKEPSRGKATSASRPEPQPNTPNKER